MLHTYIHDIQTRKPTTNQHTNNYKQYLLNNYTHLQTYILNINTFKNTHTLHTNN